MAHALQTFRVRVAPDALFRLVDTALRARLGVRMRERARSHQRAAALDASTMRDIGAARQYQEYAASADVSACSERRLHHVADGARWASPR